MSPPSDWQPWHRAPGESDLGFALFQQFLTLDPPRDLRRLAKASPLSRDDLECLSRDWEWSARVRFWDDHLSRLYTSTVERHTEETAREVAERQLGLTGAMQELAHLEIRALLKMRRESGDVAGVVTPRDALRLAANGIRLERLIRGETTEKVETTPDVSKFGVDELRTLRELQARAGVR